MGRLWLVGVCARCAVVVRRCGRCASSCRVGRGWHAMSRRVVGPAMSWVACWSVVGWWCSVCSWGCLCLWLALFLLFAPCLGAAVGCDHEPVWRVAWLLAGGVLGAARDIATDSSCAARPTHAVRPAWRRARHVAGWSRGWLPLCVRLCGWARHPLLRATGRSARCAAGGPGLAVACANAGIVVGVAGARRLT